MSLQKTHVDSVSAVIIVDKKVRPAARFSCESATTHYALPFSRISNGDLVFRSRADSSIVSFMFRGEYL